MIVWTQRFTNDTSAGALNLSWSVAASKFGAKGGQKFLQGQELWGAGVHPLADRSHPAKSSDRDPTRVWGTKSPRSRNISSVSSISALYMGENSTNSTAHTVTVLCHYGPSLITQCHGASNMPGEWGRGPWSPCSRHWSWVCSAYSLLFDYMSARLCQGTGCLAGGRVGWLEFNGTFSMGID